MISPLAMRSASLAALTLTLQCQRALATSVPVPDSCQLLVRAGSVKAVFACTFTGQFGGCGCPAATDGLDGFWSAPDNPGSGSRDSPRAQLKHAVCPAARVSCFPRQPSGVGAAVAGASARAEACAPCRRRERGPAGRLETVKKVLTARLADSTGSPTRWT